MHCQILIMDQDDAHHRLADLPRRLDHEHLLLQGSSLSRGFQPQENEGKNVHLHFWKEILPPLFSLSLLRLQKLL